MTERVERYDGLARLFAYPGVDYVDCVAASAEAMRTTHPEAAQRLDEFGAGLACLSPAELEEVFTRSFDLNPVCCPEVGWHLFGERYDRGAFLVWMRGQLREYGIREQGELSDHLLHVLPVLGRMPHDEAAAFSTEAVQPALEKMIGSLSGQQSPFEPMLQALQMALEGDHGPTSTRLQDQQRAAFGQPEPKLATRK